ncbi:MAG: NADH-quinone oxidoreductase subunit A [Planctomycetota bacterium]|jgi:NADH-quinone oxidoreductase subunit A|nr:NADH-quinone oxidoreductase subunit A [Planctomycetota bacterium]
MNALWTALVAAQADAAEVAVEVTKQVEVVDLSAFKAVFPLTVLVLIALAVPLGMMALSWLLRRNNPSNPEKDLPYECGLRAVVGSADERFSVKFYLIAMLFLVFDLEVAFLYPWAVQFKHGGWGMLGVLLVFLVMLEAGYLYLYRKGALDWDD